MSKTKTYAEVLGQIESLQQEAQRLHRKEVQGVVARIRAAIDHYGLTAPDLGLGAAAPARMAGKAATKKKTACAAKTSKASKPVKYRDESGRGWGGIGKRPQWLRDALAAGRTLQDFAVRKG